MLAGNSAGTRGEGGGMPSPYRPESRGVRTILRWKTFEKRLRVRDIIHRGLGAAHRKCSCSGDSRCGGGPVATPALRPRVGPETRHHSRVAAEAAGQGERGVNPSDLTGLHIGAARGCSISSPSASELAEAGNLLRHDLARQVTCDHFAHARSRANGQP